MKPRAFSKDELRTLRPLMQDALAADAERGRAYGAVAAFLDSINFKSCSQCCIVGGVRYASRGTDSGEMPCPCGFTPTCEHEWYVEIASDRTGSPDSFFTGRALCRVCDERRPLSEIAPQLSGVITIRKAST